MQKIAEKYNRHETLTNTFLLQLAFAIGCAIYAFLLMKSSTRIEYILIIRTVERVCFIAFAVLAVILLAIWISRGKTGCRTGFFYSLIFSLENLYLIVYSRIAAKIFGGYFYNIMYGEFKTLLVIIGIGTLICFVSYIIKDNMPKRKLK